jgi:hypothetical protein
MNLEISCHRRVLVQKAAILAIVSVGLLTTQSVRAQGSSELSATYGRGVHAYFNHQTDLAEEYFSRVIQSGTTDPRVYYFRAMTRMSSNRQEEAKDDMRTGAAFEASDPGNRFAIGRALERVQGPNRRLLESFRQQARIDRLQKRRQQTRQRYEQLERREPVVLRRRKTDSLEEISEPSQGLPGQPDIPVENPRADAPDQPKLDSPEDDPFGSPAEEADPAATEDDPFGGPSDVSDEPAADESDPFGDAGEEDDLFGEPDSDDSESDEPAAEEDDPFGDTAEEDEEPVEEEDDLFGSSTPKTDSSGVDSPSSGQIEAGQMAGILGRVAGNLFPWQNLEIPQIGIPEAGGDAPPVGRVEFGPVGEPSEVIQVFGTEPLDSEAESSDLFGEATDDSAFDSADDPFAFEADENEPEQESDAVEGESNEEGPTELESEDDPFGDF